MISFYRNIRTVLIGSLAVLGFALSENARAAACPWVGASVTVNTQTLGAGDYDCSTQDITIAAGQTLTISGNTGTTDGTGVTISAASMTIAGTIDGNGRGFSGGTGGCGNDAGWGPGAGVIYGVGAGHGGIGGRTSQSATYGGTYGSATQPAALGSGGAGYCGGVGGSGGGAIHLVITGSLSLSGNIQMNGISPSAFYTGGGAGGSIWIQANSFSGSGTLNARGGAGRPPSESGGSGGGGGGRIALYYNTSSFNGTIAVDGQTGGYAAGAGGSVFIMSGGNLNCSQPVTQSLTSAELGTLSSLSVDNGCNLTITGDLSVNGPVTVGANGASTLKLNGAVSISGALSIANTSTVSIYSDLSANSISISGNSKLVPIGNTGTTNGVGSVISAGTIDIASGSSIDGSGRGFAGGPYAAPGYGPGGGHGVNGGGGGSGAGHGGAGTRSSNDTIFGGTYGSLTQPVELGSGGGSYYDNYGGAGGGAVKIVSTGTLTVNGSILMDGLQGTGYSGGGSGGSVWIDVGTLAGSGNIFARGGKGNTDGSNGSGGGGGGRIALYYVSKSFNGSVSVIGQVFAQAYGAGENGTIYERSNGAVICGSAGSVTYTAAQLGAVSSLTVNNGCNLTITGDLSVSGPVSVGASSQSFLTLTGSLAATGNFDISNTSTVTAYANITAANLTLNGNSKIITIGNTGSTNGTGTEITVGSMTIPSGSSIDGTGRGFLGGWNSGCGNDAGYGPGGGPQNGGGGGHGGAGSRSADSSTGGIVYGSLTQPTELGSGGGGRCSVRGGNGGGAIKILATGTLTVNGSILMDGTMGTGDQDGGGAGGSIWLDANTFSGTGTLSVKGAAGYGAGRGGGGGGGRIAVYYQTKTFSGSVYYSGTAGGYAAGADGTLYEARTAVYTSQVLNFGSSTITYGNLDYNSATPAGTSVSVDVRGGSSSSPDGTWTGWNTVTNGGSLSAFNNMRYLQYRATLSSSGANKPSLDSITFNAPSCYSTGEYFTVITTAANRFNYAQSNVASNIQVTRATPASTNLKALVSFDGGSTWKKHNGVSFVDAPGGVSAIGSSGNTVPELITGLTNHSFGTAPTLDFAFGLETDTCGATPGLTELSFQY